MLTPLFLFVHFSNVARWQGSAQGAFPGAFGRSAIWTSAADFRPGPEPVPLGPAVFEANMGQHGERALFALRGATYDLFLAPDEAVLVPRSHAGSGDPGALLRGRYIGACREVRLLGLDEQRGRVHYFIGSDPAGWRAGVPTFARVLYQGLYPGIDLLHHSEGDRLEYDVVLSPGANAEVIELGFERAEEMTIDSDGDLVITASAGQVLRLGRPMIYQELDGRRRELAGRYELRGDNRVGLRPGDDSRPTQE